MARTLRFSSQLTFNAWWFFKATQRNSSDAFANYSKGVFSNPLI